MMFVSFWRRTLVVILSALVAGSFFVLLQLPVNTIAPGVVIGNLAVGGLTPKAAMKLLANQTERLADRGLPLVFDEQQVDFKSTVADPTNSELAYELFDYQLEESVEAAMVLGRSGNWFKQAEERLRARLAGRQLPMPLVFDEERARAFLKSRLGQWERPSEPARLAAVFASSTDELAEVKILPESPGLVFPYQAILSQIKNQLVNLNPAPISLGLAEQAAAVTRQDAEQFQDLFRAALLRGPVSLKVQDKIFTVPESVVANWLVLERKASGSLNLRVARERLLADLKYVFEELERPALSQKMQIVNGRAVEFRPTQIGWRIKQADLLQQIAVFLFSDSPPRAPLEIVLEKIEPEYLAESGADLGIKEISGQAETSFAGSPVNRRFNIKHGAGILNGVLVPPGAVFSTLTALGEVDREHGWRSELVIKKDKTIPEFGGGLCQVSTTLFRSVLDAGLPVLERQNHSYRVRYYEPAGMDATIYSPKPDFKFLNDTGHYLLIQSRVVGDNLTFELWGTKDGRLVELSKPKIFNIVPPPAKKLIETADLPVGKKKCVEIAHAGADAVFSSLVKYSDGTVKEKEWRSRYRPWGEVCLIGAATSTPLEVQ